jgi:hypothetical protein
VDDVTAASRLLHREGNFANELGTARRSFAGKDTKKRAACARLNATVGLPRV